MQQCKVIPLYFAGMYVTKLFCTVLQPLIIFDRIGEYIPPV